MNFNFKKIFKIEGFIIYLKLKLNQNKRFK
ncbi:hypothetical protein LCGC14_0886020 [marine sediment metagenome]|uniref:Uncharacterized protein n=1 Tax=marine sediment metagenome TaxID=412755 RepID=A0A0F9PL80_9ZZZZ